jgi:hypothetical protein
LSLGCARAVPAVTIVSTTPAQIERRILLVTGTSYTRLILPAACGSIRQRQHSDGIGVKDGATQGPDELDGLTISAVRRSLPSRQDHILEKSFRFAGCQGARAPAA